MQNRYQLLDIDLDMGTKYLINESAYFLGGMFAANESVTKGDMKHWISPVRHNSGHITIEELEEHFMYVNALSKKLSNETLMKDTIISNGFDSGKFNRLVGFGTFFKSINDSELELLIPEVKNALFNSSDEIKRCFIIGMFDGRGSIDRNSKTGVIRQIALDCDNATVGDFLCNVLDDYGVEYNYNTARDRLEGGRARKDQLRIKGKENYTEKFGFISPRKFHIAYQSYNTEILYKIKNEDNILNGLKSMERK